MTSCDANRERMAELGADAAQADEAVREHLAGCDPCTAFLADLAKIDAGLQTLPEHDASDALVAETLQAVRKAAQAGAPPARVPFARRQVAMALAASVVAVAALGLSVTLFFGGAGMQPAPEVFDKLAMNVPAGTFRDEGRVQSETEYGNRRSSENQRLAFRLEEPAESTERRARQVMSPPPVSKLPATDPDLRDAETSADNELDVIALLDHRESQARGDRDSARGPAAKPGLGGEQAAAIVGGKTKSDDFAYRSEEPQSPGYVDAPAEKAPKREYSQGAGAAVGDDKNVVATGQAKDRLSGAPGFYRENAETDESSLRHRLESESEKLNRGVASSKPQPAVRALAGQSSAETPVEERKVELEANLKKLNKESASATNRIQDGLAGADVVASGRIAAPGKSQVETGNLLALRFLDRMSGLDGLSYQSPTGYWANTYIPGDPAMRALEARLRAYRAAHGEARQFERAVRQVSQPFDAPRDAALALYLHTDTPAIEGKSRLRLQVGLKGAERQGGRRPAMNVGVVLDLRGGVDTASATRIRALVDALQRARQPEDRFSLTIAGPSGGLIVPPAEFRHGPLQVAMQRLAGAANPTSTVGLADALALATANVRAGDDPSAVLGSSLVLLVTGASLAADLPSIEASAHANAIQGVPLSVVSLAARDDLRHIDRLVAAGQGNRRILDAAGAAEALVDRELHAASRAVARALRLRIRLAPGVKLIDVLGSRRLGAPQAERVREAERSIDQRLARNLGIEADRGEDEEGIQIVIPSFYAGDAHVILLDVVAEQPGPIAEVTVRYKDVVRLQNGVARAALSVDADRQVAGPLERNVLKNLVAREFATRTREAARHLAAGDAEAANRALASLSSLIAGLRKEVTGLAGDPDLAADEAALNEYIGVLASPAAATASQRMFLADSVALAAHRKLHPPIR
jgi:Ca-activated chloride channel family protein